MAIRPATVPASLLIFSLVALSAPDSHALPIAQHVNFQCSGFVSSTCTEMWGGTAGTYRVETEMRIAPSHFRDHSHPYPNPEENWLHHHCLDPKDPCAFTYTQRLFVNDRGGNNEGTLLLGTPLNAPDPSSDADVNWFAFTYELPFYHRDNARFVLDAAHGWTGTFSAPNPAGGLTGFNFSVDVAGSGGGLGFNWDNDQPTVAVDFTGDEDVPKFSFLYPDDFFMDRYSFRVSGFVTNAPGDVFGAIGSHASAYALEDTTITGGQHPVILFTPDVYDVTHGAPEPSTMCLLAISLLGLLGVNARLRKTSVRPGEQPLNSASRLRGA